MQRLYSWKFTLGSLILAAGIGATAFLATSCGTAPRPFPVVGPGVSGNAPPTMTILEPFADITRGQGDPITIRWAASDPDDNASISFSLLNVQTNARTLLIEGIPEDRTIGPDSVNISTALIPLGVYHLLGTITDNVNDPVDVFARTTAPGTTPRRVEVRIVGPGEGELTQPPTFAVTQPSFNLSISQGDVLTVVVAPTVPGRPYNPDSDVTLYILLDFDTIPTNDDPADPDPSQIIRLRTSTVAAGSSDPITFNIPIDVNQIPPRSGGAPYFVRATMDDGSNPRVHQYAVGTINVVRPASGLVDLFDIGRTLTGARYYGFTPGANLGSTMTGNVDFDADGVDDFVLVAQFGNPRNFGPVGEAYLIYGLGGGQRFGGSISVNTVADTISGVIFEAPPVRAHRTFDNPFFEFDDDFVEFEGARTDGISSVTFVPDITGDGRPELMMGLRHVHGAFDTMDYDPGDENILANVVNIVLQQGMPVTAQVGDRPAVELDIVYDGAEDTFFSTLAPNNDFGNSPILRWFDNREEDEELGETGDAEWALIKFQIDLDAILNLVNELPEIGFTVTRGSVNVDSVNATLDLFGTVAGDAAGNAHRLIADFETDDTFDSFGGEPIEGADYVAEALEGVPGSAFNTIIPINMDDLGFLLFSNALPDDEMRVIIVPDEGATTQSIVCSSNSVDPPPPTNPQCFEDWRPRLTLSFGFNAPLTGDLGIACYEDLLVNNRTNAPPRELIQDTQFYSGGMVALINSENRDNNPRATPTPTRLDTTSIALELVGQRAGAAVVLSDFWGDNTDRRILVRADNFNTVGRIAGARFIAGGFDFIDPNRLRQPPREGWFGASIAPIGDLNSDGIGEFIISAPRNELHLAELFEEYGFGTENTHWNSSVVRGSLVVYPGQNYFETIRDRDGDLNSTSGVPALVNALREGVLFAGRCSALPGPERERNYDTPVDTFQVFAEHPTDMLGGASSAGDFNLNGIDDILAGAPLNNRNRGTPQEVINSGAVYVIYGRTILGDFVLANADDPILRAPMLRVRGLNNNDRLGTVQTRGLDVNGDRIDDIIVGAPLADRPPQFGGLTRTSCSGDLDCDGQPTAVDLDLVEFNACRGTERDGAPVFCDDSCKQYDFNNNGRIDDDDRCVFCCLSPACTPAEDCTFGLDTDNCCANMVDQGFVGIIYGGVFTDGDRDILQIGPDPRAGGVVNIAGTRFWGSGIGHQAGHHVASAGDFNGDGYGDILIAAPGERFTDPAGRVRLGVVYLIFGGPHLVNQEFVLSPETISSGELPGLVFYSPYVKGRPNEAPPLSVAGIGDINNDGFDDIAIGLPGADFIDLDFPQGPNAPGTDAAVGRRRDAGDAYIIYGNNFGTNRALP